MSGYRGGRDEDRGPDGGRPGPGAHPQQGQQGYGQRGRGEPAPWDDDVPAYGDPHVADPYDRGYDDRGYDGRGGGGGQADPRHPWPSGQSRGQAPGWDDQPGGYGTGPRAMPPGGDPSRSGGYPAQPGGAPFRGDPAGSGPSPVQQRGTGGYQSGPFQAGSQRGTGPAARTGRDPGLSGPNLVQPGASQFRGDPARSGPNQVQRGTGPSPRAGRDGRVGRDPADSGGYRMPAGERPADGYGYGDRQAWGDHDQFLPGFDDPAGGRDYRRDERARRGQPPVAGGERYGDDYGYDDGRHDDGYASRGEPGGGRGGPQTRDRRDDDDGDRPRKRKRGPIRRIAPWVALLVVLAALVGPGLYIYKYVQNKAHPADYVGAGVGPAVLVEVKTGDTAISLAPVLLGDGVIKSTRAFVLAAEHSSNKVGLEAGFFTMNRQMQASLAYAYLLDPKNRVQGTVTIPEGKRLSQILALLVKGHPKITMADYQAVLKKPAQLGLPAYAGGKPEGYLFPSTYIIEPNDTALTVLKAMVARYNQHAAVFNLPKVAPAVGMTPAKIIVVASLVQAEAGRNQDMGKIAEVLYKRLNMGMPLQFDSSVFYGLGTYGTSATTAQINKPGPYNTYLNKGLPPGPIDSPGDLAIQAALHPEVGNLLYFRGCADKNKVTLFSPLGVPPASACPKP